MTGILRTIEGSNVRVVWPEPGGPLSHLSSTNYLPINAPQAHLWDKSQYCHPLPLLPSEAVTEWPRRARARRLRMGDMLRLSVREEVGAWWWCEGLELTESED